MTARTTTLVGVDAGAYYVQAQLGYYVDPSEPSGRWHGAGAIGLGLDGDVDVDDFLALMGGVRPGTDDLLGTRHTGRTVRGFDVTCSAPKSASVLFAVGGVEVRAEVLAAHDAAVSAVVDWVETHAHVRYRVGGQVCAVDADGVVAAVFRQHTSRALDPQLHSHVVIVNRALSPDGRWLALDARTIKRDQQTLSRLYHAGLRAELTRRLGVGWREPVNGIAEMADIPDDVLAEFSKRAGQVEARVEAKLDRFEATMERAPTPRERWRLEREAVLDSRPAKTHTAAATQEQEWAARLADVGVTPEHLTADAVGVETGVGRIDAAAEAAIVERALTALGEKQSTWRPAELVRELAAAVPTNIAVPADRLGPWLDQVAEQVIEERMLELSRPIPDGVPLRRDGRPITEGAVDRILSTPEIVAQEERLVALVERRIAEGGADHVVEAPEELTRPQQELAEGVAGDRSLVMAVGPAGTGKTTALRPAVEQLRREGRAVFGVAPSAAAAEVLAVDTGVDADTLDKLLVEHNLDRRPEHRYDLPAGATVIVDEAAMVPTPRLAELVELADRRAWRLALVGDPLQFAAVGRSGMFGHLVNTCGAIELGRVHRFSNAWERDASLRLRKGDTTVIDLYDQHGRLHGGTPGRMRRAVVDAWWDSTERGETAAMMAPTNTAVVALNQEAQRRLLDAGRLDPKRKTINVGPYRIRVGDVVATRRNERKLVTNRNQMVKNRDHWTVTAVHRDNSLTIEGKTGTVRLPKEYVAENVELAYAETSHATQGRTVDRTYLYLDAPTGAAGIYVPLTRGRQSNEAFVVLNGEQTPADVIGEALSRTWIDRPAIEVRADLHDLGTADDFDAGRTGLERPLDRAELVRLLERDHELGRALEAARHRANAARDQVERLATKRVTLTTSIAEAETRLAKARRVLDEYDKPLIRRRHRTEVDAARSRTEWMPASIDKERVALAALDGQEHDATDRLQAAVAVEKARPQMIAERGLVRYQLDQDAQLRGQTLAHSTELPDRVIEHVGQRPDGQAVDALWVDAAGHLEQHAVAYDDDLNDHDRHRRGGRHGYDDNAYEASRRAAQDAIARLDRALGRHPEIEPAHRDLGISL